MAIDQLPTPPSKLDPATFNARAEALVAALQTMINQINSQIAGASSGSSLIFSAAVTDISIGGTGDKFILINSTNSQKAGIGYQQNSVTRWKEYVDVTTGDYVMERFNTSGVSQGVVARVRSTDGVSPAQSTAQKTQMLTDLKDVDGIGSGLDADLLRGLPADFTSSLATNGYQKLPSGLIIQWGTQSTATNTVVFPISFPNICVHANWNFESNGFGNQPRVIARSKTGFTLVGDCCCSCVGVQPAAWFAIGY